MRRLATFLACAALSATPTWGEEPAKQPGEAVQVPAYPYWIGAMCVPTELTLRDEKRGDDKPGDDDADDGLTVVQVLPDSPAAKGGLRAQDIIVKVDGKELDEVDELLKAVSAGGGKALKLEVLREGKPHKLTVTPEKRPEGDVLMRFQGLGPEGMPNRMQAERLQALAEAMRQKMPEAEAKQMQDWVEKMRRGDQQPLRMHVFGPGVVMHSAGVVGGAALPEGVTVTIKKTGAQPMSITVERGDETWTVNDRELGRLPQELQAPVGAMVGGGQLGHIRSLRTQGAGGAAAAVVSADGTGPIQVQIQTEEGGAKTTQSFTLPNPQGPQPGAAIAIPVPQPGNAPRVPPAVEFEKLRQQVEQLQRRIDELQKQVPAAPSDSKRKTNTKE